MVSIVVTSDTFLSPRSVCVSFSTSHCKNAHMPQQPDGGEQGVSGFTGLIEGHPGWKVFGERDEQPPLPSGAPKANVIPPFVLLS